MKDWPLLLQSELFRVLFQSLIQSSFSAIAAVVLGLVGALGLVSIKSLRARKWIEIFIMLPSLLPSLFVILSTLNLVSIFMRFPFGLMGVVVVHAIMNAGFMAVALARLLESRAGGLIELATIEAATFWVILKQILLSLKSEIIGLAYVVFVLSFASFTVPLVVGAESGQTIEVLIYRILFGQGDWSRIMIYSLIQLLMLGLLSFFIWPTSVPNRKDDRSIQKLGSKAALFFTLAMTAVLIGANFCNGILGFKEIFSINGFALVLGTLTQSIWTGVLLFLFFSIIAYLTPNPRFEKFLYSFAAPSTIITGLLFYYLFDTTRIVEGLVLVILAAAFSLTVFSTLFRLRFRDSLNELQNQILIAKTLGASRFEIFFKIVHPQLGATMMSLAALGAFWASGDFALSTIISSQKITLAMVAQTYLGSYRLHLATAATWPALLVGGFVYLLFEGISYVYYSKSHS